MIKNVVVVGATSAIAQATCRHLASRERANFYLLGRQAERLEAVASDLRSRGAERTAVWAASLTDPATAQAAPGRAEEALGGPVDLVLIAHGSLSDETRAATDLAYAAEEIQTNFASPCWFALAAANHLAKRTRGGQIAVITSVAGDRGRASNFFYGSCKAGLIAFCSGLRARLHADGVAVTDLRPGLIATPMTAHLRHGPLSCSADKAGELCARAIRARRAVAYVPGLWRLVMLVIRLLPGPVFQRLRL